MNGVPSEDRVERGQRDISCEVRFGGVAGAKPMLDGVAEVPAGAGA
jgi:hypothetical protein